MMSWLIPTEFWFEDHQTIAYKHTTYSLARYLDEINNEFSNLQEFLISLLSLQKIVNFKSVSLSLLTLGDFILELLELLWAGFGPGLDWFQISLELALDGSAPVGSGPVILDRLSLD